jgi:hypothetical protein
MAKKSKKTKTKKQLPIVISAGTAQDIINDIRETLAEAYALQTSEHVIDIIEQVFKSAGIPPLKGKLNKAVGVVGFKGPSIQVGGFKGSSVELDGWADE